jgi:putative membrane protein
LSLNKALKITLIDKFQPMLNTRNMSFQLQKDKEAVAIFVMIVLYTVGIIGFIWLQHLDFMILTPINLILSLLTALFFHKNLTKSFYLACLSIGLLGYFVEVIGVNTGLIFGSYQYGRILGFKILNTPLSIGVNWLLLVYCSSIFINHFLNKNTNRILKSLLAAGLMVALDVLIEPVAIATDMWHWASSTVPLQNYIGWFVSAFILHIIMSYFT